MSIEKYIRTIPDFPHEGIMFRDVTTLFGDADGFKLAVDQMIERYKDQDIDKIAGLEARGFLLGGAMAYQMGKGFIPVRKKGKLPAAVISEDYQLEYGQATLEVHLDAVKPGERVLIIDDLLATGGTATAGINLVERLGGVVVGCGFIIDLPELGGGDKLKSMGHDIEVLCAFEGA